MMMWYRYIYIWHGVHGMYHRIEFYEMMNLNNVVSAEVFFAGNFCFLGRARN